MSEEQLKTFIKKVKSDTCLQEKLNGAADSDAVLEIAKEAGFSITAEDIQSLMQSTTVELSDEELEGAAGGRRQTGVWWWFWQLSDDLSIILSARTVVRPQVEFKPTP